MKAKAPIIVTITLFLSYSVFSQSNQTLTGTGSNAASLDLRNGLSGFWHLSGPRSFENNNNISLFWNDGTNYNRILRILDNGNIGIGVSAPNAKLDLDGKFHLRNGGLYINSGLNNHFRIGGDLNTTGYINIHQPNTLNNTFLDYTENFYIRRIEDNPNGPETNLGAIMGFQYDGTVTIGIWETYTHSLASNPDNSRLLVNGGISCERLKVVVDVPDSDHVFDKTYDLKSIEEVERFIKKNKHLPEIPSADRFKENGYYVGEMDDLLLRKVEELTLYIIELQNRINDLEQR